MQEFSLEGEMTVSLRLIQRIAACSFGALFGSQARPEEKKAPHDSSDVFEPTSAQPITGALKSQPQGGEITGFDFYLDPLNADRPMKPFTEIFDADVAAKPKVMEDQQTLLALRYVLEPKLDPQVTMTRGKPLCVGPTARLSEGMAWEKLADLSPDEVRENGVFPYPSLPHPKHVGGGQVIPGMAGLLADRLVRPDVGMMTLKCRHFLASLAATSPVP